MADYIERKTVLNALSVFNDRVHGNEHFLNGIETAKEIVDKTLSADVAPVVHGRWELAEDGWYCTACELYPPFDCDPEEKGIPYCPHCGAKMDLVI